MRKMILALALALCIPPASYAASIGGAETQGKNKIAVGFDSAFIFDRDLKFKSASGLGATQEVKDINIDKGNQQLFKASYGILDWLDIYTKLGVSQYDVDADVHIGGAKSRTDKIKAKTDFAYGFGLKGAYPIKNNWILGIDAQYLRSKHEAKVTETTIATGAEVSTTFDSTVVQEWHVAPYIGYKLGNFIPYLGVRYSDMRLNMKKPAAAGWTDNHKYEADGNVGVFVGTDYKIGEHWKLNLEGRFVDETAMSFGASYRF